MAFASLWTKSTLAAYVKKLRKIPKEMIWNKHLLFSTLCYATASIPLTWDQGSSSVIPILPGFQEHFRFSNHDAGQLRYFVSIVFVGAGVGALLSLFINDRLGRLWAWRLYTTIWIIGQLIMCFTPTIGGLWVARIVCGMGIGPLTVIGTMAIVEIAPTEIRGLLAVWFSVLMNVSAICAIFAVLGSYIHLPPGRMQYQIVWFSPCIFFALMIGASFFLCESPRWLWVIGRHDEAVDTLVKLRGLPASHPRVQFELDEIQKAIEKDSAHYGSTSSSLHGNLKEAFTVRANLRRLQQVMVCYALAQLSGANSITSYFIPILNILGEAGDTTHSLFLTAMYSTSKLFFTLISSFLLVDNLGRRNSLLLGASLQMLSHIYLGVYIKYEQAGRANGGSSQAAIAMLFIHAFGYAIGLFILPYVFGGEVWPNRIRSFGGAISQSFHWLFFFAMNFALPSLLTTTNNWGAFLFFAACCLIAITYVFFMVPETAGLSVEELDALFEGPWFEAYRSTKKSLRILEGTDLEHQEESVRVPTIDHTKAGTNGLEPLRIRSSSPERLSLHEPDKPVVLPTKQKGTQKVLSY